MLSQHCWPHINGNSYSWIRIMNMNGERERENSTIGMNICGGGLKLKMEMIWIDNELNARISNGQRSKWMQSTNTEQKSKVTKIQIKCITEWPIMFLFVFDSVNSYFFVIAEWQIYHIWTRSIKLIMEWLITQIKKKRMKTKMNKFSFNY